MRRMEKEENMLNRFKVKIQSLDQMVRGKKV